MRVLGVDAPELRGRCARERQLAEAAHAFVRQRTRGGAVVLYDIRYGKYAGRVVARVGTPGGGDLATALVAEGLARAYDGGARPAWC